MQSGTHFAILPRRINGKSACWGPPPIPRQGPLALPCQTLHLWSGYAPFRALNTSDLTGWKEVCLQRPAGRAASPLRAMKKAADGALFRGLGSNPQQALCRSVYTLALFATIVFSGIGIPAAHENSPGMRRGQSHAGAVLRNDRNPFSEV